MRRMMIPGMMVLLLLIMSSTVAAQTTAAQPPTLQPINPAQQSLPVMGMITLLDFGAGDSEDSLQLAPIMAKLKGEYHGKVAIISIDMNRSADLVAKFKVKKAPTQIFFDAKGQEHMRHEGFLKESIIVGTLTEMGVAAGPVPYSAVGTPNGLLAPGVPNMIYLDADVKQPGQEVWQIFEGLRQRTSDKAAILIIDVNTNKELAQVLTVKQVPCIIFFNSQGQEEMRWVGELNMAQILKGLQESKIQ